MGSRCGAQASPAVDCCCPLSPSNPLNRIRPSSSHNWMHLLTVTPSVGGPGKPKIERSIAKITLTCLELRGQLMLIEV